jgi:hypothetical protein
MIEVIKSKFHPSTSSGQAQDEIMVRLRREPSA